MPAFRTKELTHAAMFGIGSAFSEGPCPYPGPLYKVYTVTEKSQ